MLDQLESMERAAEKRLDEMYIGDDKLRCSCDKIFDIEDGVTATPNPYSELICPDCMYECIERMEKQND